MYYLLKPSQTVRSSKVILLFTRVNTQITVVIRKYQVTRVMLCVAQEPEASLQLKTIYLNYDGVTSLCNFSKADLLATTNLP